MNTLKSEYEKVIDSLRAEGRVTDLTGEESFKLHIELSLDPDFILKNSTNLARSAQELRHIILD